MAANAQIPSWRLDDEAPLDRAARRLVERTLRSGRLTGRGLGGVRRVARTVADLVGHDGPPHRPPRQHGPGPRAEPTFLDGRAA